MIPQGIPGPAPMGVAAMSPEELMAMLSDPRTPPGTRAAAMRALQMRQPQGVVPTTGARPNPAAVPPQSTPMGQQPADGVDVMGALQQGAAMADRMRGMAKGGAVRGYADGSAVSPPAGGVPASGGASPSEWDPRMMALTQAIFQGMNSGTSDDDADQDISTDYTPQDRGLALAEMGFGMAAANTPHLGQAIGVGGMEGIKALQQMRQQRAILAMKQAALQNQTLAARTLAKYRGIKGAQAGQTIENTAVARFTPQQTDQVVKYIIDRGDVAGGLRMGGMGIVGTANRADIIRGLNASGRQDLTQAALAWKSDEAQAAATGRNIAGPDVINLGAGQTRNIPAPVPGSRFAVGAVPGVKPPAPTAAPSPGIPVPAVPVAPAAPTVAAPATPAPPPAPTVAPTPARSPYDLLPVPQPLPQPTSTGMKDEIAQQADALGKLSGQIDTAANAAKQSNFVYDNMSHARDHFVTGKGAGLWNEGNAYLLQAGNVINDGLTAIGADPIDLGDLEKKVANFQDFRKNSVVLTGAATKAVSPRASTQEMNFLGQGVPGYDTVDRGYNLIVNQLQAVNDFALAQQKAKQLYLSNPKNSTKTLNGFDSWYNESIDPAVFMLHRMSPEDAADAIASIKKRPNGAAIAAKIAKQMTTARDLGLFEEQ